MCRPNNATTNSQASSLGARRGRMMTPIDTRACGGNNPLYCWQIRPVTGPAPRIEKGDRTYCAVAGNCVSTDGAIGRPRLRSAETSFSNGMATDCPIPADDEAPVGHRESIVSLYSCPKGSPADADRYLDRPNRGYIVGEVNTVGDTLAGDDGLSDSNVP